MIDSHTHLDHLARIEQLGGIDQVLQRAQDAGLTGMISIGCGVESIRETLAIAHKNSDLVRVAAGVHPMSAAAFDMNQFSEIEALAEDELVVAIGETGFDQYHDCGSISDQMPAFQAQCELARKLDLPLIIHSRNAEDATIDALEKDAPDLTVILHCFALSKPQHLNIVLEHDNWVCSFAGNVSYPSAQDLRDAAKTIPLERIMVETDAPYLAPVPYRGKRNEPAYVIHTLKVIAEAHNISIEQARKKTIETTQRVYKHEFMSPVDSLVYK